MSTVVGAQRQARRIARRGAKKKRTRMKKIVCIGSLSQDIFFPMENMNILNTPEDITSQKKIILEFGAKYAISDRFEVPGGCAANVSQGLSRLGVSAACIGVLGKDSLGVEIRGDLEREGIDVTHIQMRREFRTDLSFILVDKKTGDRTILYNRDANEHLEVDTRIVADYPTVFVSGLYGSWVPDMETISNHCSDTGTVMFYNPGQRNISENMDAVLFGVRSSFGVFLNKDEAIEIVVHLSQGKSRESYQDEDFLLRAIKTLGPSIVSITDGSRGAWVFDGTHVFHAVSGKVENVVDSTGAGDAYASAFLAAFLHDKDLPECIAWGIANGRSVIQYYGARDGLLHSNVIEKTASNVAVKMLSADE